VVQRELETTLAKALLRGDFVEEDTIIVSADDQGLVLRRGPPRVSAGDNAWSQQQPALSRSGSGRA
jgi:ATP-dependent Clp protease ATP-binding subunit ClpB